MMNKYIFLTFILVLGVATSCADLEIPNQNEPDAAKVFASAADIANIPGGAFVNLHQAVSRTVTGPAWSTNADVLAASWGNFGIRNMSWEPRIPIDNSLTSNDAAAIGDCYGSLYGANSSGMDLELYLADPANLPVVVNNVDITAMLQSVSSYIIGRAHMILSVMYDKGFNADGSTDLGALEFSNYQEVRDFAVAKLENAANIAAANTFTLPNTYINGLDMTSADFAKLARTVAAQAIALNARNGAENTAADWVKVLALANGGIDFDYAPIGDDNLWYDDFKLLGGGALVTGVVATTWARVDVRVMNMMDPAYPTTFPSAPGAAAGVANTADLRIASDFLYMPNQVMPVDRGTYRFSNYAHNRYAINSTAWAGIPMPHILKAENDLMIAEALVRTGGSKATAAGLINNTWETRGGLPALTGAESDAVLLDAIYYEKIIELMNTWGGRELAEVRRFDKLQAGSFEQLPVPGGELTLLGEEIYTFGGVE